MAQQCLGVGNPEQRVEQAAVAQISPQMLHHPLHDIPRIGGDRPPDEGPMGDREIIPRGWLRHAEGSRDLGVIQDPAGQPPQHFEKTAEPDLVEARKQPFDVAEEIGLNVLLNPPSAERGRGIEPGLRESASSQENGAISMIPTPARQTFGHRPDQRRRARPGDDEPALLGSMLVDGDAERRKEVGEDLGFIEGDVAGVQAEECIGIAGDDRVVGSAFEVQLFHLGGRVRRRVVLPHWRTPSKATQGKVAR